jgi:hypothetical protein
VGDPSDTANTMKYRLLISQGMTPTTVDPEAWTTLFEDEQRDTDMS